jgi:hypothetical protein
MIISFCKTLNWEANLFVDARCTLEAMNLKQIPLGNGKSREILWCPRHDHQILVTYRQQKLRISNFHRHQAWLYLSFCNVE